MRRFGEAVVRGQRYRKRPGAYAVLERDGRVLLTCQLGDAPEFQLPGGGIDPGEGAIAALHREAFEETGWSIANPCRLGAYRRFAYMPDYGFWAEKICTIFRARPILCHGAPLELEHRAIWVRPQEAAELLSNVGDRYFLRKAFGLPPERQGWG